MTHDNNRMHPNVGANGINGSNIDVQHNTLRAWWINLGKRSPRIAALVAMLAANTRATFLIVSFRRLKKRPAVNVVRLLLLGLVVYCCVGLYLLYLSRHFPRAWHTIFKSGSVTIASFVIVALERGTRC